MLLPCKGTEPRIGKQCFIAPSAALIGDVVLGPSCSVWFNATIRGDDASIHIGKESNVQDNAVIHCSIGVPTTIGERVTIGHGAIIHSCTIGDDCLIGMGSIILDGAVLPSHVLVGAGSLIPQGKTYPPRSLVMGSPAKAVRPLTEKELEEMHKNAQHYCQASLAYAPSSR